MNRWEIESLIEKYGGLEDDRDGYRAMLLAEEITALFEKKQEPEEDPHATPHEDHTPA